MNSHSITVLEKDYEEKLRKFKVLGGIDACLLEEGQHSPEYYAAYDEWITARVKLGVALANREGEKV